jgi:hypothetical protein
MNASSTLHQRYFDLIEIIEQTSRVADWRSGDIDLWPLARQDLFLDMFRRDGGDTAPARAPFPARAVISLASPITNFWKSRHDLAHWLARPHRAHAMLLGDGVSLDRIDGVWRDRYGEPVLAALNQRGDTVLALQPGTLTRLPWFRPTLAMNALAGRAALAGTLARQPPLDLPDYAAVLTRIEDAGVAAPSLERAPLERRARMVAAQADAFDRVLRIADPKVAFTVTSYAGLGPSFALACRRRGILCVDLQHCPHEGAHRGYHWSSLPISGYSTLPGLFWTWSAPDAAQIDRWAATLDLPWHRAIHGGHTQIAACEADAPRWQEAFERIGVPDAYEREILVALQPVGGQASLWSALADTIAAAPSCWRWWIRRHPASTSSQDAAYGRLLALDQPNVMIEAASDLPLPVLMRRMDALVSLASGAAGEAAAFGVPAIFLSPEALEPFGALIARGDAVMADPDTVIASIARLPTRLARAGPVAPAIEETLARIDRLADDYARLCQAASTASPRGRANRAG